MVRRVCGRQHAPHTIATGSLAIDSNGYLPSQTWESPCEMVILIESRRSLGRSGECPGRAVRRAVCTPPRASRCTVLPLHGAAHAKASPACSRVAVRLPYKSLKLWSVSSLNAPECNSPPRAPCRSIGQRAPTICSHRRCVALASIAAAAKESQCIIRSSVSSAQSAPCDSCSEDGSRLSRCSAPRAFRRLFLPDQPAVLLYACRSSTKLSDDIVCFFSTTHRSI